MQLARACSNDAQFRIMTAPVKISPLLAVASTQQAASQSKAGWSVVVLPAQTGALRMHDHSANAKLIVEGARAAQLLATVWSGTPTAVNAGWTDGHVGVYCLRPDRYLVHGAAGTDDALEARVRSALPPGQLLSVTNITHGRAEIQLVGTQCVALLSRLCALNFAENEFPNMRAKQTSVAKISQVVVRCDAGGLPAYTLIGARSLGQYLLAALLAAGAELGAFPAASNNQH
jgi:heterotetrameric sarcosine oxidase gamma subunit